MSAQGGVDATGPAYRCDHMGPQVQLSLSRVVVGVLGIGKLGAGQVDYHVDAVAKGVEDYYTGAGEAPGEWMGRGAARLGLVGQVAPADLRTVLDGLDPATGARLAGKPGRTRVPGWDLTFSAPKSVSALWAIGGPQTGGEVAAAHAAAVRAGLDYLETHAGVSRRGRDGYDQIATAGLAAAVFDHRSSRAGDPQLHSHALVVNNVRCADGLWRTIDGHEM
jgi:conjugative relaxase-like TrwC/TraI family protein